MAEGNTWRCRGLRKWSDRRCEASTNLQPAGYPLMGYYCPMHSYQKPRQSPDGALSFETPAVELHVRRTSFVAPEAVVAGELVKAPGLVKDRPGAKNSVAAVALLNWLRERKGLDEAGARAYAQRMLVQQLLQPVMGGAGSTRDDAVIFSTRQDALYRVMLPSGTGGYRQ